MSTTHGLSAFEDLLDLAAAEVMRDPLFWMSPAVRCISAHNKAHLDQLKAASNAMVAGVVLRIDAARSSHTGMRFNFEDVTVVAEVVVNPNFDTNTEKSALILALKVAWILHQFRPTGYGQCFVCKEVGPPKTVEGQLHMDVREVTFQCAVGINDLVTTACATPVIDDIENPVVNISCATSGASIYYTTDGSEPLYLGATHNHNNGTLYAGSFAVSTPATVKARAYKTDLRASLLATETIPDL